MKPIGTVDARSLKGRKHLIIAVYASSVKPEQIPRLHPEWAKEFFAIIKKGDVRDEATATMYQFGDQVPCGQIVVCLDGKALVLAH